MANQTEGKRFEATGPNEGFGVFGVSGFYTKTDPSSAIDFGVNVVGNKIGVYGECIRDVNHQIGRDPGLDGIGVFGIGDKFGIFGNGNPRGGLAGVAGIQTHGKVGVFGVSIPGDENHQGNGIVGLSLNHVDPIIPFVSIPDPATGSGTGVFGSSGKGSGVRGTSDEGKGGEFGSETGIGVKGFSNSGNGGEFRSETGIGVKGFSKGDRGGVFESDKKFAQVRLVPSDQRDGPRPPELPKKGQVGDLMLIRSIVRIKEEDIDTCSLWLCIPKDHDNESDQWQEIDLGRRVTGTLE